MNSDGNTIRITDLKAFRAAISCQSIKDVRYYLNGVKIDWKSNKVCGSNGIIYFEADCINCDNYTPIVGYHNKDFAVIRVDGNIPKIADSAVIHFEDMCVHVFKSNCISGTSKCIGRIPFTVIADIYPTLGRILDNEKVLRPPYHKLDMAILGMLQKAVSATGCKVEAKGFKGVGYLPDSDNARKWCEYVEVKFVEHRMAAPYFCAIAPIV